MIIISHNNSLKRSLTPEIHRGVLDTVSGPYLPPVLYLSKVAVTLSRVAPMLNPKIHSSGSAAVRRMESRNTGHEGRLQRRQPTSGNEWPIVISSKTVRGLGCAD